MHTGLGFTLVLTTNFFFINIFEDMPTGNLVSWLSVPDPAISLTFSPTGDFLATAHIDNLGIFLWTNRSMFTGVSLSSVPAAAAAHEVSLPLTTHSGTHSAKDELDGKDIEGKDTECIAEDTVVDHLVQSPDQIEGSLVTLSALPRSRWENLANLDAIKQRNKPKEPPKAPERAPFFLSSIPGLLL